MIEIHKYIWRTLQVIELNENQLTFLEICINTWESMATDGNPWSSMRICAQAIKGKIIDRHGYLWKINEYKYAQKYKYEGKRKRKSLLCIDNSFPGNGLLLKHNDDNDDNRVPGAGLWRGRGERKNSVPAISHDTFRDWREGGPQH